MVGRSESFRWPTNGVLCGSSAEGNRVLPGAKWWSVASSPKAQGGGRARAHHAATAPSAAVEGDRIFNPRLVGAARGASGSVGLGLGLSRRKPS
jgi:hypothetical protein